MNRILNNFHKNNETFNELMDYDGVKTKSEIEETDTKRLDELPQDQNFLQPTADEADSIMSNS